jgi:hypothetical protein
LPLPSTHDMHGASAASGSCVAAPGYDTHELQADAFSTQLVHLRWQRRTGRDG